jgi:hypothetical protein
VNEREPRFQRRSRSDGQGSRGSDAGRGQGVRAEASGESQERAP